jgi:hypothetical protein
MNGDTRNERTVWAYAIAVLGAFLIVAFLVWAMHKYTQPEPLGANRAAERAKALAELQAAEHDALNNIGWVDQTKGIVRLRIEDAMKIVQRDWSSNPTAARSNLIARVEKATAVVAPPPSPFE